MAFPAPTLESVAALLRTRTNAGGEERGIFDADTRPTGDQVTELIGQAVGDVISRVGEDIPPAKQSEATRLAALQAAALVELSYFPNQIDSDRSAYRQYTAMYLAGVTALQGAIPNGLRLI